MQKNKSYGFEKALNENFISFYQENYTSLCYFANRYTNDPLLAEDVVGDVALKVWEKRGELRNEAALKSYFYTSLRNACLDRIAKEKTGERRRKQYEQTVAMEQGSFVENIIRTETLRELEMAINSLPTQCRRVFIKLFREGKTLSEAADEMGLSLFTVKAQRQRGLQLLRKKLSITSLILSVFVFFFY